MHRTLRTCSTALLLTLLPCLGYAQVPKRNITEKDLFAFKWIGDIQLSPDGRTALFVQASVTPDHSGYETSLWVLDLITPGLTPRLLTPGTRDTSPRWSPDGKQIAFLRVVEKDGKPSPPQLYLIKVIPGGNPIKLTEMPKGVSSPLWYPRGQALAVLSLTPMDQKKAKLEAEQRARATGDDAHVSDVRIINQAIFQANGHGFLDPSLVPQIYTVYLPQADGSQPAPWQLTEGRYGVKEFLFTGDNRLLYSSQHEEEPIYDLLPHNSIFALDTAGVAAAGASAQRTPPASSLVTDLKLKASDLALSRDGKHLAFHSSGERQPISHQQTDVFTLDLDWTPGKPQAAGTPRNLTGKLSYEMGSGVFGDNVAPRGGGRVALSWNLDGTQIYDIAGNKGSAHLVSVDALSGAVHELTAPKQAVLNFASTPDRKVTVALISNPVMIGDLYAIGPNRKQTQLTSVNKTLFDQLNLTMPLDIQVNPTVHAADVQGQTIDTFIQLPPAYNSGTKLPLILNIHGGPHAAYGWVFDHEMQWMAAKGYAVVYPNPRGSTTYGQKFANVIMNNYPGDDFHDLMDTVDAAIKLGYADPERLGVTGGSGGGLLTDWVVTQTTRFKAAVAQRDITDWAGWWYTADITGFHQAFWPKTPPFDNPELFRAKSPITFVGNIRTPMMFILGDEDSRTPPTSGGEEFFRALKYRCIPTVMLRFPRESHELSRSGEPWHRIERLENILNWFNKFLLNEPEPRYEIAPNYTPPCSTNR